MFQEGKIKTYHEDRGFGFIEIEGEKKDLFFHIKDFPNRNVLPKIGEKLKFRKVEDAGKFKADYIVRLDLSSQKTVSAAVSQRENNTKGFQQTYKTESSALSKLITVIGLVIIVILAVLVYGKYQTYKIQKQQQVEQLMQEQQRIVAEQRAALGDIPEQGLSEQGRKNLETPLNTTFHTHSSSTNTAGSSHFKCDGREHCGQMGSYEEALFFIRNCPNTKMDGDHDGIPCEDQFGHH